MNAKLEHINLHVGSIDETLKFLRCAFPEFQIRFDSQEHEEKRWAHFGDANTYFALYQADETLKEKRQLYSATPGVNHFGLVVDDVELIRQRLEEEGYQESTVPNNHHGRKRIYFFDPDGNDWEFIQYLSLEETERNDYSDALKEKD